MDNSIKEAYESLEDDYLKISKDYLKLTESGVEEALIKHTAVYAFFAAVLSHAKSVRDLQSIQLEMAEATVMEGRKADLIKRGEKSTQGGLNSYILTVPKLISMREDSVDADRSYNLAKNIVSSLDHQKDLLIQLSANKRAEIKLHEL